MSAMDEPKDVFEEYYDCPKGIWCREHFVTFKRSPDTPWRSHAYCWLVLCPVTDRLGCLYRGDDRLAPRRWLAAQAQVVWFRTHNCRASRWVTGS